MDGATLCHAEGIKRMMYFFYFACLPGLAALGYYNYIVEVNHMAHLEEHPADRTVYPYNRYEEVNVVVICVQ